MVCDRAAQLASSAACKTLSRALTRSLADSPSAMRPPSILMQIIQVWALVGPPAPVDQAGMLNSVLTLKPTANAKAAAAIPMKNVSSPDRHHAASAHRLLMAPIPKKATPVAVAHVASPP